MTFDVSFDSHDIKNHSTDPWNYKLVSFGKIIGLIS